MKRCEAKAQGLTHYNTGKPCRHGHLSFRYTSTGGCIECLNKHNLSDAKKRVNQKYRDTHKSQAQDYWKKHYLLSIDYQAERKRRYYLNNRDKVLAISKRWANDNKPARALSTANRRARISQAIPPWATKEDAEKIREIYRTCPPGYHVDHIVPLNGKAVCGLHVPGNLQHLPAEENQKKFNKFKS